MLQLGILDYNRSDISELETVLKNDVNIQFFKFRHQNINIIYFVIFSPNKESLVRYSNLPKKQRGY